MRKGTFAVHWWNTEVFSSVWKFRHLTNGLPEWKNQKSVYSCRRAQDINGYSNRMTANAWKTMWLKRDFIHLAMPPDYLSNRSLQSFTRVAASLGGIGRMLNCFSMPTADAPRAFHPRCLSAIGARAPRT